ncbi:MAG: flavodoxin-dependent (E)-4-hydroxy-3-methylbut-2-enyl-diphosphate synthase [Deferribacteraceae bacterium]|jgi:(E)-4-hydroxy-3-methylbut-2-enyl-diphosphate synthase|nr:flavodoxin-dependent (E)-4-hydroxy-3-methylbut-2-enyl-diphosphate synthase [Deferribacteraceae bacterium]
MLKHTREITIGSVKLGGDNPVLVQSMTNTDTRDVQATVAQILRLQQRGCELIRSSVPDEASAAALPDIIRQINIPLIADIHFDYRLAIAAMKNGAAAVRINPGNVGGKEKALEVICAAKDMGKAIRIGVNGGSLEADILKKQGRTAKALVDSAMRQLEYIEATGFTNYKVSLKASSVPLTVEACTLFAEQCDIPQHIGVTEAGTVFSGTVKSAMGIGALLLKGIGSTLRVSLTAAPEEELRVAWAILQAAGLRKRGAEVISCPTCARTDIDIISLAEAVEARLAESDKQITVAVMGCVVNGPGEATEADYGIAGGKGVGLLFKKGQIIKKVAENELINELMAMIEAE